MKEHDQDHTFLMNIHCVHERCACNGRVNFCYYLQAIQKVFQTALGWDREGVKLLRYFQLYPKFDGLPDRHDES